LILALLLFSATEARLPLPFGERVTFFACAKKVTKETHPGRRAFRASCPPGSRMRCGGPLTVRPCTAADDRASCAVPCGLFPPRIRRALRGPVSAASCRRNQSRAAHNTVQRSTGTYVAATRPARAVRGAEHRSQRRKRPEGARRGIAALAQQYTDVLSARPRRWREAQGSPIRRMRIGPPRSALDLFGYFLGQCQKVTRSPKGSGSSAIKQRSARK
jgi:hypothetical protein